MKTKDTCWWLLVLLVFAVTACGEKPTGPEAADLEPVPVFAKGGKPGAPSGDIHLRVVFEDDETGIRSDGYPEYAHDSAFVSAVIRDNGMLYFQTFDGKQKDEDDPERRDVEVDLGLAPPEVFSLDDLNAFKDALVEAGDQWPVFMSDVTLHTRSTDGGMYTMKVYPEVGSTLLDAGKIGFNDYGDASWEWRLLFGTRIETPEGGVDHYEEGFCITHPDEETWHVMTDGTECGEDGDGVDDVSELWRVVDGAFIHVADFHTPMHLTLTRKE
jgi:hypothetical protein